MAGVRVSERGESDVGIGYGAAGDPPVTPVRASLGEIARYFARLGVVAFGGPTAHISMMQEELVEQRRWVDRQYFVDMLAATQLAPGPNSTEMAIHVGWLHQGRRGLVVAGVCFILPAFLIVLGISLVYGVYGALPEVAALFYGMQPVIVAIIMVAVVRMAPTACRTTGLALLAAAAAALTLWSPVGVVWVILGGGLVGIAMQGLGRPGREALAAAPLVLLMTVQQAATDPTLSGLFWFFLKIGATAMGSGYVIASYLNEGLVERLGWLTESQVLDAIAVGQMTPGPVFATSAFAGYVIMAGPGNAVAPGVAGAVVSTIAIFLPSFVIVWLMAPWLPQMRRSVTLGAFLDGVSAAVVGSITATSLLLLRAAVVDVGEPTLVIEVGGWSVDLVALMVFGVSLFVLLRFRRLNSTWLILMGAIVGMTAAWLKQG
jgi:chromate transporter